LTKASKALSYIPLFAQQLSQEQFLTLALNFIVIPDGVIREFLSTHDALRNDAFKTQCHSHYLADASAAAANLHHLPTGMSWQHAPQSLYFYSKT